MYGLVNKAIEDLARSVGGESAWQQVQQAAGVDVVEFTASEVYEDDVTYRLVMGASEVLGIPPADVLRAFGRHWILYTGREGYGPMMTSFGSSLEEFIANLDSLHARVTLVMPHLQPPSFSHEIEPDGTLVITYASERPGLADMVVGLLEGMGEMFDDPVQVTARSRRDQGGEADIFAVSRVPAPRSALP